MLESEQSFECVNCHKVFSAKQAVFCDVCGSPVCPSYVKTCKLCKRLIRDPHAIEQLCIDCKD